MTLGQIRGSVSLDIKKAVAAYATLRAQNARTVYALRGTGDAFVRSGQVMGVAGAGMVYAFSRVVMAAADFEKKMDFFGAVTDTNSRKMAKLSDFTLQLATDTIYSADQIADGFIELGKAGISAEQIMRGIGVAMTNLGAAGDIPLAESGQIITSTIQQFDLAARDAVAVTDLLAGAANASIADITDIGVSLKYVGGVANAAGLTFEDTATAISLLAKAGIRGSTAGTSLRQMIVSLGGATEPARDVLKELGIITEDGGNKFFTAEGKAKSLQQVFQILQKSTEDLTQKERLMALRTIFNNRALSAASILTREGAKGFREMNAEMAKTTAADVAAKRMDNLSGDIEILKGNIQTLMIQAGTPFQETLRGWVQQITKLVQAFGELDPNTQKAIVQFIGLGGAALVIMGAFNIILGTIFRFIAHLIKLGAGMKFLVKIIGVVITNLRWFALILSGPVVAAIGAITVPVAILIAIIAALALAFIVAYKKIEPFRNFIQTVAAAIGNGIKAIVQWFLLLARDPGAAWDQLKSAVSSAVQFIGDWLSRLPSLIQAGLSAALSAVGRFVSGIVQWFFSLPGRILGALAAFVSTLTQIFTLENIAYAVGFAIGTIVRLFLTLPPRLLTLALQAVTAVITAFGQLAPKIGYAVGFAIGTLVRLMIQLGARVGSAALNAVVRIVSFFRQLPGRAAAFFSMLVSRAISFMQALPGRAASLASNTVSGIINFFQALPGRAATFFINMANRIINAVTSLPGRLLNISYRMYNGFMDAVSQLPGAVSGVMGRVIDAFLGVIRSGYEAAKSAAGALWNGFKDGLGISSPSFIERAAWQITGVLDEETKKMKRQTLQIQKIGAHLANQQFRPDLTTPRASEGFVKLARDQASNQQRARTLLAASQMRRARAGAAQSRRPDDGATRKFHIDNWREGTGHFRDIAQDVVDDNAAYDDSLNGMG